MISRKQIDCRGNPRKAKLYMGWALDSLPGIDSVLDIGAGDGAVADILPSSTKYSGLDIGADIYQRTERVKYIESFPALREAISQQDSADLVTLFDVLEHTDDFVTLFRDALNKSNQYVFVSLPNEMNIECRLKFLMGQPVPAHGLSLVDAKPGHKHQWLITYQEAKEVLTKQAEEFGFTLSNEVFIRNLPNTGWKSSLLQVISLPLSSELVAHGLGYVFMKLK